MAIISSLLVRLGMRTAGFEKGVKRSRKSLYGLTRDIRNTQRVLGRLAVAGASAGSITYFTKRLIDVASAAEETQSKFNVVFKEMADAANTWAKDFGKSVGRAELDVKRWMATLQDTFVPLGMTRQEGLGLTKTLTKLAVDVASFNNAADDTVLRDFTSALVGNHETVRKYGIIITESTLKQEALRQGIQKTYKQLTDIEKVQLRYSMLLRGTADAQGDALRTAGSYANQVKRLKANLTDLQQALGEQLLPAMTELISNMNIWLSENEDSIKQWSKNSIRYIEDVKDAWELLNRPRAAAARYARAGIGFAGFIGTMLPEKIARIVAPESDTSKALSAYTEAFLQTGIGYLKGAPQTEPDKRFSKVADKIEKTAAKVGLLSRALQRLQSFWSANTAETTKFTQNLDKIAAKYQEQIATFGYTQRQVEYWRMMKELSTKTLAERLKLLPVLARILSMMRQLDAIEKAQQRAEQMKQWRGSRQDLADAIRQQNMTPLERFNQRYLEATKLMNEGFLEWQDYMREITAARMEYFRSVPMGAQGYAQAYNPELMSISGMQMGGINYNQRILDEMMRQTQIAAESREELRQIKQKESW